MSRYHRAWKGSEGKRLAAQVIREEPFCTLQLAGCTGLSTTADHIIPASIRPDLVLERTNLRGACAHCNYSRRDHSSAPSQPVASRDW